MKHNIEVFTTGCHLCTETLELLATIKTPDSKLTEYNILEKCVCDCEEDKAAEYGIAATPTIVVDGKIAIVGKPTEQQLRDVLGP